MYSNVVRKLSVMPTVLHGGVIQLTLDIKYDPITYHMIGGFRRGDPRYALLSKYKYDQNLFPSVWFTGVQWLTATVTEVEIPTELITSIRAAVWHHGERITYDTDELEKYFIESLRSPSTRLPPSERTHATTHYD